MTDFEKLYDLMMLEQFKHSVPEKLAVYIGKKKVSMVAEAAALAGNFMLPHKRGRGELPAGASPVVEQACENWFSSDSKR